MPDEQKWTAAEMEQALAVRYPDKDWVRVHEIELPNSPRRIDLMAVCRWGSRKHQRVAVEIKVARSDLLAELADPSKADAAWKYADLFVLAVPAGLIDDSIEIPEAWQVVEIKRLKGWEPGCAASGATYRSKIAQKGAPGGARPWPLSFMLKFCERAADPAECVRREDRAYRRGAADAAQRAEKQAEYSAKPDEELRRSVHEFTAATGIPLDGEWASLGPNDFKEWTEAFSGRARTTRWGNREGATGMMALGDVVRRVLTDESVMLRTRTEFASLRRQVSEMSERLGMTCTDDTGGVG